MVNAHAQRRPVLKIPKFCETLGRKGSPPSLPLFLSSLLPPSLSLLFLSSLLSLSLSPGHFSHDQSPRRLNIIHKVGPGLSVRLTASHFTLVNVTPALALFNRLH